MRSDARSVCVHLPAGAPASAARCRDAGEARGDVLACRARRERVPPAQLALASLLRAALGVPDHEAVELTVADMRRQMVLDCVGALRKEWLFSIAANPGTTARSPAAECDRCPFALSRPEPVSAAVETSASTPRRPSTRSCATKPNHPKVESSFGVASPSSTASPPSTTAKVTAPASGACERTSSTSVATPRSPT